MPRLLTPTDRRILKMAVPALGALAVEPLYVFVDTVIVGRIGTAQQAGLGAAAAVLALVFSGSNFLTYGTTERVARRLGARDTVGAANVGVQTMWLSLGVGVISAVVVGIGAPWWVGLLGADAQTSPHAVTYLRISAVGLPAILWTLGAQGVLRGASDYVRPMWVLLATNGVNVAIEMVLVFVLGWGIAGSAWSTVIAQVIGAAVFAYLIRARLASATQRMPSWNAMSPLMSAGWFLILRVFSMLAILTVATRLAQQLGAAAGAAHSIVTASFLFSGLVLDALAMPAQTLVAEALGGAVGPTARQISNRVARLSLVGGIALSVMIWLGSGQIASLFSTDPEVILLATDGLTWLGVGVIPGSIAFAYDGVLIGAADYRFIGVAAFVTTVGLAPFAVWLAATSAGLGAIWAVLALWFMVRAIITWSRATRSRVLDAR